MKRGLLVPVLLLALGIVLSTVIAQVATDMGWLVLSGPVVMALAMVGASVLGYRRYGLGQVSWPLMLILGGSLILAGAIMALKDPGYVATMMPILGAGAAVPVLGGLGGNRSD